MYGVGEVVHCRQGGGGVSLDALPLDGDNDSTFVQAGPRDFMAGDTDGLWEVPH